MAKALVFAAYIPDIKRCFTYTDKIKETFGDCDVYIGINSSYPVLEQVIREQGFTNIVSVDKALEVTSDASAYQAALKLLKDSGKVYDTVYFTHSKGTSYADDTQWKVSCDSYFVGFCKRRHLVDEMMNQDNIGGTCYVGRKEPMNGSGYEVEIAQHFTPRNRGCEDIMSLITMYGISGEVLHDFLSSVKDTFFTTKLENRYFFETSFPLIVDLYGKKRAYIHMWD